MSDWFGGLGGAFVGWSNPSNAQNQHGNAQLHALLAQQYRRPMVPYTPPAPRVAPEELSDDPLAVRAWHALDLGASIEDAVETVLRQL